MTDPERQSLVPGDCVAVLGDDEAELERVVRLAPWQLGHGEWVIGLCDVSGGYLLSRVVRKVPYINRDLTDREAKVLYDTAPEVPISEERIQEIVAHATKPMTLQDAINKARGGPPPTPFQGFA